MRCKTCKYQYVLNEGDCGACPRYCLKCTESKNGLTCTQCQNRTVMMPDGTCERKLNSVILNSVFYDWGRAMTIDNRLQTKQIND